MKHPDPNTSCFKLSLNLIGLCRYRSIIIKQRQTEGKRTLIPFINFQEGEHAWPNASSAHAE